VAVAALFVLLGGHPQLPIYALAAGGVYALWRRRFFCAGALALGGGASAFVWLPLTALIGRSTRILPLDPAANDVALPVARLAGYFFPWLHGAPWPLARAAEDPFGPWPRDVFWDTVCYVGWAPWLSLAAVVALAVMKKRPIVGPERFVLILGAVGLVLALPHLPVTFLRSPARLLYFTELALAV